MKNDSVPTVGHTGKFITCLISHSGRPGLSSFLDTDKVATESAASPTGGRPFLIEYTFNKQDYEPNITERCTVRAPRYAASRSDQESVKKTEKGKRKNGGRERDESGWLGGKRAHQTEISRSFHHGSFITVLVSLCRCHKASFLLTPPPNSLSLLPFIPARGDVPSFFILWEFIWTNTLSHPSRAGCLRG